jgi:hypothetical protein
MAVLNPFTMSELTKDPVEIGLRKVGIYPKPPEKEIGGVKLSAEQYDNYSKLYGQLAYKALRLNGVGGAGWTNMPPKIRAKKATAILGAAKKTARETLLGMYHELGPAMAKEKLDMSVDNADDLFDQNP